MKNIYFKNKSIYVRNYFLFFNGCQIVLHFPRGVNDRKLIENFITTTWATQNKTNFSVKNCSFVHLTKMPGLKKNKKRNKFRYDRNRGRVKKSQELTRKDRVKVSR